MDLQVPQNNINDSQHHSNIRLFKWAVEISMRKPHDDNKFRADGVFLIRATIVGASTIEVIAVPYSIADVKGPQILTALHESLTRLHVLGSLENLPWITYDLLLHELLLTFGPASDLLARLSRDFFVMFFDLKINQSCMDKCSLSEVMKAKIKWACSNRMLHISDLRVNAEVNLEKTEEIEECLKACPGMVVENSRGMEEVKSLVEIGVSTGSEEECAICLMTMGMGYRHVITCCGHKFHKECMIKWIGIRKLSFPRSIPYCPMCRNTLYFVDF